MIVDTDVYEYFAEKFPSDRGVGGFGSTAH
jgi:hypothetical protein